MLDLSDRVVLVTGSAGTIGRGICRRLAGAGASLGLSHLSASPVIEELMADLDVATFFHAADITDASSVDRMIDEVANHFGRIDAVVNCAGIQPTAPLASLSPEEWRSMLDVNLTGTHLVTQAAAARMALAGGGSIVHIASIEGMQPEPLHGHYATAKAGVIMHARAAAIEFGADGIRVNSVSPGLIGHDGLPTAWPEGIARWKAAAPLGRLGTPEDIGDACVFLVSPLSRWITGTNLVVDGGVSARPTW